MEKEYLEKLYRQNYNFLINNCLKYWEKFSPDYKYGGYYTCFDKQWNIYNSDKSVWFQGRGAWLFSRLYNQIQRNNKWLELAKNGVEFLDKYCFDSDGRMYFEVTFDGRPLRKRRYFFSETFAIIAFAEYAKASGNEYYLEKAKKLYERVINLYNDSQGIEPKVIPQTRITKALSPPMILLATSQNLREVAFEQKYDDIIGELMETIFKNFYKVDEEAMLETVGEYGERLDSPQGRCINPGHSIETSWFLMHEGLYRNDMQILKKAFNILNWSLEKGWDNGYGGLLSFVDIEGKPTEQLEWDMKLWWPHTEAMYATLLANSITGEEKYRKWFDEVYKWSFEHFEDRQYGEWFGYLHRDGTVAKELKGSMWKGMFHLPRALLLNSVLLKNRINSPCIFNDFKKAYTKINLLI